MSRQRPTQTESALQQVNILFGEPLSQVAVSGITHTYQDVFRFCKLENIDYRVLRYLNTRAGPFEVWAEEWLHDMEV
jgi:hypothetical protein